MAKDTDSFRMTDPEYVSSQLNVSKSVGTRVAQNMTRIVAGTEDVYSTPLEKAFLKVRAELLSKLEASSEIDAPLRELELAHYEKMGPKSRAAKWTDRRQRLENYFQPYRGDDLAEWEPTFEILSRKLKGNLRPVTIHTASENLKKSTSASLPFMVKKGLVLKQLAQDLDYYLNRNDPAMLYTRVQQAKGTIEGGKGNTRDVWGMPGAVTLSEMRYFLPVLQHQKKLEWRVALMGPTYTDQVVSNMMDLAKRMKLMIVSMDYDRYDASCKPELMDFARRYITSLFQSTESQKLAEIFSTIYNIGIVTPEGVWEGPHGVPSGTTFTNEIDSIVNYLAIQSSNLAVKSTVQGDDAIAITAHPEQVVDWVSRFGLDANKDKSFVSSDYAVYLQNYYSDSYVDASGTRVGVYSVMRAWSNICYSESWSNFQDKGVSGQTYNSLRTIQILEGLRNHPFWEWLVRRIYAIDKFQLEFKSSEVVPYFQLLKDERGAGELVAHRYGDEMRKAGSRGMDSFATIRLLKELRG